jgi:hypothetical protein
LIFLKRVIIKMIFWMTNLSNEQVILSNIGSNNFFERVWAEVILESFLHHSNMISYLHFSSRRFIECLYQSSYPRKNIMIPKTACFKWT